MNSYKGSLFINQNIYNPEYQQNSLVLSFKNISNDNQIETNIYNQYKENILNLFIDFMSYFTEKNIQIKDKKSMIKFFIDTQVDYVLLEKSLSKIKSFFPQKEITVEYDTNYESTLMFCIRQFHHSKDNLNEMFLKIEDEIIDMLEENKSRFNIVFYTDYKQQNLLNV